MANQNQNDLLGPAFLRLSDQDKRTLAAEWPMLAWLFNIPQVNKDPTDPSQSSGPSQGAAVGPRPGGSNIGAQPLGGLTAFGPGDTASAAASGGFDDQFTTYVVDALWKEGVDVTAMDQSQLYQLYQSLWDDQFVQDVYSANLGGGTPTPTGTTIHDPNVLASLTDANIEAAIRNELFDPTKTHNQYLVSQGLRLSVRA